MGVEAGVAVCEPAAGGDLVMGEPEIGLGLMCFKIYLLCYSALLVIFPFLYSDYSL